MCTHEYRFYLWIYLQVALARKYLGPSVLTCTQATYLREVGNYTVNFHIETTLYRNFAFLVYVCVCVCIYIYIYIYISFLLWFVYMYMYTCIYTYMYIYLFCCGLCFRFELLLLSCVGNLNSFVRKKTRTPASTSDKIFGRKILLYPINNLI